MQDAPNTADLAAAFLTKAHEALNTIFASGSHGPEVAGILVGLEERIKESPGLKVRAAAVSFLLESKKQGGSDFEIHSAFLGNPIMLAAAVQHFENAYQKKMRQEDDAASFQTMMAHIKEAKAAKAGAAGESEASIKLTAKDFLNSPIKGENFPPAPPKPPIED